MDFHNKIFRSVSNTENGEVGQETIFYYQQSGSVVTATYKGGSIVSGHLIAKVNQNGELDMRYHHINTNQELMTGICHSKPEIMVNGKLRLHENWKWTSGDETSGNSIVEEI